MGNRNIDDIKAAIEALRKYRKLLTRIQPHTGLLDELDYQESYLSEIMNRIAGHTRSL